MKVPPCGPEDPRRGDVAVPVLGGIRPPRKDERVAIGVGTLAPFLRLVAALEVAVHDEVCEARPRLQTQASLDAAGGPEPEDPALHLIPERVVHRIQSDSPFRRRTRVILKVFKHVHPDAQEVRDRSGIGVDGLQRHDHHVLPPRPDLEVLANAEEVFASFRRQADVLVEGAAFVVRLRVRGAQLAHLNLRPTPAVVALDGVPRLAHHVQHLLSMVHQRVLELVPVVSVVAHRAGRVLGQVVHDEGRADATHGHHAHALGACLRARQSPLTAYPEKGAQESKPKCACLELSKHLGFLRSEERRTFLPRPQVSVRTSHFSRAATTPTGMRHKKAGQTPRRSPPTMLLALLSWLRRRISRSLVGANSTKRRRQKWICLWNRRRRPKGSFTPCRWPR
eukprot:scaffold473_cov257-Pinguiococcus_pyrenoidosus.AAC.13